MTRFFGKIGYSDQVETPSGSGVYKKQITERSYYGDVIRNYRQTSNGEEKVNADVALNNSISVVADAYLTENYMDIVYVAWRGGYWTVSTVEVQSPRLVLQLGGVYNGPAPSPGIT